MNLYLQPLIVAFKKNKNAKEAIGMKAYMLHQFKFAGIKSPTRDLLVKQFLKENKQRLALGSASKNARPILEKTGILDYFDVIVDGKVKVTP